MSRARHPYACFRCGATSYRPVIARDSSGALRPTRTYRCTGCSVVFEDPRAWRGAEALQPVAPGTYATDSVAAV